jgi:hypothetical protein
VNVRSLPRVPPRPAPHPLHPVAPTRPYPPLSAAAPPSPPRPAAACSSPPTAAACSSPPTAATFPPPNLCSAPPGAGAPPAVVPRTREPPRSDLLLHLPVSRDDGALEDDRVAAVPLLLHLDRRDRMRLASPHQRRERPDPGPGKPEPNTFL